MVYMNPGDEIQRNDNPLAVDELLSKEMLQLSMKERNAIQEEIHGVDCLAREETPELLRLSLLNLALVLENDELIPPDKKQAYRKSQQLPRTYVNDDSFRMRFLRFALFDTLKAAEKMCRFLSISLELFGDCALERAVRLSDFDNQELRYLREGLIQFLPFRDQSGRRILVYMNPLMPRDNQYEATRAKAKVFHYMTWTAGEDIDVQRKGLVFLVKFTSNYHVSLNEMCRVRKFPHFIPSTVTTVRPAAVHLCSPDTPVFRFVHAFITMRINQLGRKMMKIHFGKSVEVQYALHSYGIPTEHIPLTFSGNIKDGYVKQWMKMRGYVESIEYESDVVECPQLEDVLFRQGVSSLSYPGNSRVHRLVESRYQEETSIVPKRGSVKSKRQKVIQEIIEDIRSSGGRFLVWNDHGWWNRLSEIDPLTTKLEYFIKEILRAKKKEERIARSRHRLNLDCSTSMFQHSGHEGSCGNKRKKSNEYYLNS